MRRIPVWITVQGCKIQYSDTGNPEGEPLLLLHGWGCSGEIFAPLLEGLGSFRLLIPDFPGHGQSEEPPATWGVTDFASAVYAILEENHITRCCVIAHSFGGRVALKLAADHPALFRRMILTGCAGIREEKSPEQLRREKHFKQIKSAVQAVGKVPFLRPLSDQAMQKAREHYGSKDYQALSEGMRSTFVKVIGEDLRPLLPLVRASVLLVWGDRDTATPLWMGRIMEKEIPDAGLAVFEGDDHFAFLHQWQRFVAVADYFLKESGSTGEGTKNP